MATQPTSTGIPTTILTQRRVCFDGGEARDVLAGLAAAMFRRDFDLIDHCRYHAIFIDELLKLRCIPLGSSGRLTIARARFQRVA
jgi:hypothetical protein